MKISVRHYSKWSFNLIQHSTILNKVCLAPSPMPSNLLLGRQFLRWNCQAELSSLNRVHKADNNDILNEKSQKGILYNIDYKGQEPCSNQLILDLKKKNCYWEAYNLISFTVESCAMVVVTLCWCQLCSPLSVLCSLRVSSTTLGALGEITPWCLGVSLKSRGIFLVVYWWSCTDPQQQQHSPVSIKHVLVRFTQCCVVCAEAAPALKLPLSGPWNLILHIYNDKKRSFLSVEGV